MSKSLDGLTEAELRRLYVDEGLTETEIADRFGTYQVKINRLRQKYGIASISKSDRLDLPLSLAPRLHSILMGSMLGDGGLRRTGSETASYHEHHSEKQRPYLDWKVAEWGTFFLSTIPADKKGHRGFRMMTHGCRVLFPFWQTFYPSGKGEKVFLGLDPDAVDDLALAVWFMDDGSRTESYVRFSVSPVEANQRVLLRVLKRHKLDAQVYGDRDDVSIHVQGRTSLTRFIDKVAPHLVPSMAYKLDLPTARKAGPAPRHVLTVEAMQPLRDRGLSAEQIGQVFGVSRQSVLRALDRAGIAKPSPGRPKASERTEFTVEEATEATLKLTPGSTLVDEVLAILVKTAIPIQAPSEVEVEADIDRLRSAPTEVLGSTIAHTSTAGALTCARFFPHRWDARYRDNLSPRMGWYDREVLRKAICFQLRVGDPVTPVRVFRAVQVVVRAPTNFRPAFAKALIEHFCPKGGVVLDPCAGYGGRAAGAMASDRKYIGVDPHPDASRAFTALATAFKSGLVFHNAPFEEVDLGDLQADLVFTSPPYFSVERYSNEPTQSWVRYKTWDSWIQGFLTPFVQKSFAYLRTGGVFCVNTKDVRVRNKVMPIGGEVVRLALKAGFTHEATMTLPLGRIGKVVQSEPIFVFRKV